MNTNPNNCATCDYSKMGATGGWCYMWRSEPKTVCISHTGRKDKFIANLLAEIKATGEHNKENADGNQD